MLGGTACLQIFQVLVGNDVPEGGVDVVSSFEVLAFLQPVEQFSEALCIDDVCRISGLACLAS